MRNVEAQFVPQSLSSPSGAHGGGCGANEVRHPLLGFSQLVDSGINQHRLGTRNRTAPAPLKQPVGVDAGALSNEVRNRLRCHVLPLTSLGVVLSDLL